MAYKLEKEILLKAKRQDVWETYRDQLTNLVTSMPSVEKIEVINREVCDDGVRIKNLWHLAIKFPKPIQKLLPQNFMSYYDLAFWNKQSWVCEFSEVPIKEDNLYSCVGENTFKQNGESTLLLISFTLTIDPNKIPGIPGFLKKGMISKIEKIISHEVAKNLALTARQVETFINDK